MFNLNCVRWSVHVFAGKTTCFCFYALRILFFGPIYSSAAIIFSYSKSWLLCFPKACFFSNEAGFLQTVFCSMTVNQLFCLIQVMWLIQTFCCLYLAITSSPAHWRIWWIPIYIATIVVETTLSSLNFHLFKRLFLSAFLTKNKPRLVAMANLH